jgi:hypothetical protein
VNDQTPKRVRVTGPPRRTGSVRPPSRLGDVHEQTALGDIYLKSLLREQLLLAGRILLVLALTLIALPLVFQVWPAVAEWRLLGIPFAWIYLGVLGYPLLVLLGWRYIRRAERNERDFMELVRGEDEGGPA